MEGETCKTTDDVGAVCGLTRPLSCPNLKNSDDLRIGSS